MSQIFRRRVIFLAAACLLCLSAAAETGKEALQRLIDEKKIINAHEHLQNEDAAGKLLEAMDRDGIKKCVLLGSSRFTFELREHVGFSGYDEHNAAMLRLAKKYPERFEAWPTIDPEDPEKLEKLKQMVADGASGLKLYIGHGYIRRRGGEYMFHTRAMDDPEMLPVYAYLEEQHLPVCFHVNPVRPGFLQEFVAVLEQFPDLKVNCPHYMLSTIRDDRLREMLDTFPNLYIDISFGHDEYMREGLRRFSRNPEKYRELFNEYPERFLFALDLVVTGSRYKSPEWYSARTRTYYDLLSEETFETPLLPGEELRGLALGAELIENVLHKNFERFKALEPDDTEITREIRWWRMSAPHIDREPGEAAPPPSRRWR